MKATSSPTPINQRRLRLGGGIGGGVAGGGVGYTGDSGVRGGGPGVSQAAGGTWWDSCHNLR